MHELFNQTARTGNVHQLDICRTKYSVGIDSVALGIIDEHEALHSAASCSEHRLAVRHEPIYAYFACMDVRSRQVGER